MLDLHLEVVRVESNPQLVQIVPPNEVVVLISFELTLSDVRGMMNLCIPFNSIERIGGKLSSNSWSTYGKNQSTPDSIKQLTQNLQGSVVELVAQLAETKITTGELIGLRVGDIITTQQDIRAPLAVNVEGLEKFRARAGCVQGACSRADRRGRRGQSGESAQQGRRLTSYSRASDGFHWRRSLLRLWFHFR